MRTTSCDSIIRWRYSFFIWAFLLALAGYGNATTTSPDLLLRDSSQVANRKMKVLQDAAFEEEEKEDATNNPSSAEQQQHQQQPRTKSAVQHSASGSTQTVEVRRRHRHRHRRLSPSMHMHKQFISTLTTCNANIDTATCHSWSTFLSTTQQETATDEIKIPCGTCVTLDTTTTTTTTTIINLPYGLNIVGKLHIPNTANIEIRTKFILVQGILQSDPPPTTVSTIPRSDQKTVTITLTGTDNISFTPDDETGNAELCTIAHPCTIGIKPFAVAGGMIDIQAIDPQCPTWTKLQSLSLDKRTIQLTNPAAATYWAAGAELLFTPEDTAWDYALGTIASTNPTAGTITLTSPLDQRKTSVADGYGEIHAVEVALLTRTFTIQPDNHETTSLIGGHVIIYHTPAIRQHIEGVELYSMGQQGNLGRYPIHFHMSENCEGSIVRKNLVRASHQRCYVAHGTHNVTFEENVAFDTFGHCYMTEDGAEWTNMFRNNLGAYTRKPSILISPEDSDNFCSTFWITQPSTHHIGNVAAGSESSGFWLEVKMKGPGAMLPVNKGVKTKHLPLGLFVNNTSHSNWLNGFAFYPSGYKPRVEVVLEGLVTFKNTGHGVFFHSSDNIKIAGGYFGDNRIAMRNFRVPNSIIEDVTVVGISDNRKQLVAEGRARSNGCRSNWELVGITIQPNQGAGLGTILNRVQFENFDNATGCTGSHAILVEHDQVREGIYNSQVTLSSITFGNNTSEAHRVDACKSIYTSPEGPVTNIAIEDHEGAITGVPGFLVQENDSALRTFLPNGGASCRPLAGGCLYFCPNACLQLATVTASGNSMYAGYKMTITDDKGTEDQKIRQVWKEYDGYHDNSYFGVALPGHSSEYTLSFVNEYGEPAWPGYVKSISYERRPQNCDVTLQDNSQFVWDYPEPSARCNALMKNGDFELGSVLGWQNTKSGFEMMQPGADGSSWALRTGKRTNKWATLRYTFDPGCFRSWSGEVGLLSGKIRTQTNNGKDVSCASDSKCAPKLAFELRKQPGELISQVLNTGLSTVAGQWSYFEVNITLPLDLSEVGRVGILLYDSVGYKFLLDDWDLVYTTALPSTTSPTAPPATSPTTPLTPQPTPYPTSNSLSPSSRPSSSLSANPSASPSLLPSVNPSQTLNPSSNPQSSPTGSPTSSSTSSQTLNPSSNPQSSPTGSPTSSSTSSQTLNPSSNPQSSPTGSPTSSSTSKPFLCEENKRDKFNIRKSKTKTCSQLSRSKKKESWCAVTGYSELARVICPITCGICSSPPTSSPTFIFSCSKLEQSFCKEDIKCDWVQANTCTFRKKRLIEFKQTCEDLNEKDGILANARECRKAINTGGKKICKVKDSFCVDVDD